MIYVLSIFNALLWSTAWFLNALDDKEIISAVGIGLFPMGCMVSIALGFTLTKARK